MKGANLSRLVRCESQLHDFLDECLSGMPVERILEPAIPEKWSANENLAHLARYHEVFLQRIDRILNEHNPVFGRYKAEEDPEWPAWRALSYKEVAGKLAELREKLVAKLKSLSDEAYERTGTHPALGEMTLAFWVESFLVHEGHHLYLVLKQVSRR